ncbi:MAG: hypothetical protein AB1405_08625 [Bdellovibrionota bacterium]
MKSLLQALNNHFECVFLAYLWMNSAVLAALVGRPLLGLIGLLTVLPFIAAYVMRVRGETSGRGT